MRRLLIGAIAASCVAALLYVAPPVGSEVLAAPGVPGGWVPALVDGALDTRENNTVTVGIGDGGDRKVELRAERSPAGADDWSDTANLAPYYSEIILVAPGETEAVFTIRPRSLQGGYDYRIRARQWNDGDGGNPSPWGGYTYFSAADHGDQPIAPYPLTPRGDTPPADNILRVDGSALEGDAGADIVSYEFAIHTAHNPFIPGVDDVAVWTETVPFAGPGATTSAPVDTCQDIPGCTGEGVLPSDGIDYEFRWMVRSIDSVGGVSEWSRWRYINTRDTQDEYFYVPNRAGSYLAGLAQGNEASGLTASKQYPDIYWFIRDAGDGEDRAMLYAIKIDPVTGRLQNINGSVTREIPINGAENVDWEAVEADDRGNLWIGDIGDFYRKDDPGLPESEAVGQTRDRNNTEEPDVLVIRVPEPDPYVDTSAEVTKAGSFVYPDGATYNSEAMFWVDDWLFLVTKEVPRKVYRFPSYISRDQSRNELRYVGEMTAELDPITDAAVGPDNSMLALTTASQRVVVFDGVAREATTSAEAEAIVSDLLLGREPRVHYYYRDAGAFAADGVLDERRPEPGPEGQWRQTTMEVEGVAFNESTLDLAMISEFGRHVLYVPPTANPGDDPLWGWQYRTGSGTPVTLGEGEVRGGDPTVINDPEPAPGVLVDWGSSWIYRDSGVQPVGFQLPGYDDSGWYVGSGQIGAGNGDEDTVINRFSPMHVTDYFRRPLEIADASAITSLHLTMDIDDGAIVYINGVPVVRHNMVEGVENPPEDQLAASGVWDAAERVIHEFDVVDPPFVDGLNWITVEVHQWAPDSSDVAFNMLMVDTTPPPAPEPIPTDPPVGTVVEAPGDDAAPGDGPESDPAPTAEPNGTVDLAVEVEEPEVETLAGTTEAGDTASAGAVEPVDTSDGVVGDPVGTGAADTN